jgi:hypothetical protein
MSCGEDAVGLRNGSDSDDRPTPSHAACLNISQIVTPLKYQAPGFTGSLRCIEREARDGKC